jgi:hypothetical protein
MSADSGNALEGEGLGAGLIVASGIAGYAAVVSTLSLVLAIKVYRSGEPKVDVDWEYFETDRELTVSVLNTGRAGVTISTVELYVIHEQITKRSPNGRYVSLQMETIAEIPPRLWRPDEKNASFPARLSSQSLIVLHVRGHNVEIPQSHPLDELLLKFVARFPKGKEEVYLRGDVLRHFLGIDPSRPIRLPSPGSLPRED